MAERLEIIAPPALDPTEPAGHLLRRLRTSREGLTSREAARRLVQYGPNELHRKEGTRWPAELFHQFTHPLALLLWAAAGLAWSVSLGPIAIAIVVVIVINAAFALLQELQAEHAVEALRAYLPEHTVVMRDGRPITISATQLVPGDILLVAEGDSISADARLIEGAVEVDLSTLTGESLPAYRSSAPERTRGPLLQMRDVVFSGTTCTEGEARGVVFATGMQTEIGRIAALSQRVKREESPLEAQVRRVAMLIAAVAVGIGVAFVPIAVLAAGLSFSNAVLFAVGLLVGNVPEGLLPVITLALAAGVRDLAARNAVVKRLSAVETLGSTDVICTDKTGTLTENRMRVTRVWVARQLLELEADATDRVEAAPELVPVLGALATSVATCNNAELAPDGREIGDPTETALLLLARRFGTELQPDRRRAAQLRQFHFDPALERMTTLTRRGDEIWIDTKGAPEQVLPLCSSWLHAGGDECQLDDAERASVLRMVDGLAADGLRVLAVARRALPADEMPPQERDDAESGLCLLGVVGMVDPPRPEVAPAVARCKSAGIRIIVVTGDHAKTAEAIARSVGIVGGRPTVLRGEQLDAMSDRELDRLLRDHRELIFARTSPEAKLRIADALQVERHIVAMTGDGVNDAPALRAADIGVAMGRSGTDVAREASTMVLADDNFATVVVAVEAGRRVYDNVRKFIFYIFAHATPEIVPYLVFALAGGAVPLPLPVLQLLAIDIGTETLPALALGREPAEPGIMERPPRPRSEGVIKPGMLVRAWLFLGLISAALGMAGFFWVLNRAGWSPGDPTGAGTPLHDAYHEATTMLFTGLVMGQVGTAFAARTERASLRSIGPFSNPLLLWGIAFELALTALLIYTPLFNTLIGTAPLSLADWLFLLPFPFIVWGADELRRALVRRRAGADA